MKNINQKIVILAIFVVVVATGIYLFWPRDNEVTEISQPVPAPQEQNQPVQATEDIHEPAMCNREAFTLMGTACRMTPSEETGENYANVWSDFERYNEQLKQISTDKKYYGVTFGTQQPGQVDYITAMAVPDRTSTIDQDLVIRRIPAAQYAVFECPVQQIGPTYQYIMSKWLPASPYTISPSAPSFEEYPPEGQDGPVFIYIPVTKKGG
jgi:predicted transcriptional regulator YdeE